MAKEKDGTKTTAAKTAAKTSAATVTKIAAKTTPAAKTAAKAVAPAAKSTAKPAAKATAATAAKANAKPTAAPTAKKTAEAKAHPKETAKSAAPKQAATESKAAAAGKFVIKRTDKDNFVFKLFSSNGRVVAVSTNPYSALASCKSGINSVINNAATAPIEDQTLQKVVEQKCPKWVIFNDKRGEVRLRLIAANGQAVAATNDGYTTKDAAKKGIDAIARAAENAEIERNDNLW